MGRKKKGVYKKFASWAFNKYILAVLGVAAWVIFFDKNDLLSQIELTDKLRQLRAEKEYYILEIEKTRSDIHDLETNPESREKFAREKYLMKKENEDIFVIVRDTLPAPANKTGE